MHFSIAPKSPHSLLVQENFRIYDFTRQGDYDGLFMSMNIQAPDTERPSSELLRLHFRNCVLANVRGGAELPSWRTWDLEDDFDLENTAKWGAQVEGQSSRLEVELAGRLGNLVP